jgi:hypothetical protein
MITDEDIDRNIMKAFAGANILEKGVYTNYLKKVVLI